MFSLEGVRKTYSGRRGSVDALRDVTLTVETGSFLAITGPSGSGKTTLLLTLGGLIRATAGRVGFKGVELNRLSEGRLAEYRNRMVGFVLQTFNRVGGGDSGGAQYPGRLPGGGRGPETRSSGIESRRFELEPDRVAIGRRP
jgi:predicted ABC-type transport system involved in lysophospholipase L1 biosynthesis ATPase subunit